MRIEIKKTGSCKAREFAVVMIEDYQSFELAYKGTRKECLWYAEMLKICLERFSEQKKVSIIN